MQGNRPRRPTLSIIGAAIAAGAALHGATAAAEDQWQFSLGAGVISKPEYPGAKDHETKVVPLLSASYGRYFIGGVPGAGTPAGIGMYLYQDQHWRLGAAISGDLGKQRKESDDDRLRGLGDIDGTARGGVFGSYTLDRFTLRGNVLADIGGKNQGTLAALDLEARFMPAEGLTLTAGPGIAWGNGAYNRTYFGIDAEQAARSGRAVFDAKSGIHSARFSLGANYRLTPHRGLGARVTAAKLRNDAADSPITVYKSPTSFGLFASYRF